VREFTLFCWLSVLSADLSYTVNLSALPISLSIYLTELYGYWEFFFLPMIFSMRSEVYSCVVLLPILDRSTVRGGMAPDDSDRQ